MNRIAGFCGDTGVRSRDPELIRMIQRMGEESSRCLVSLPDFACYFSESDNDDSSRTSRTSFSENDRYFVLFQGELYYREKYSDPSGYILTLLQSEDPAGIWDDIEGIYFAVVFDKSTRRAYFASDRMGLRFLYLYKVFGGLLWATEPKAFTAVTGFNYEVDRYALDEYFRFDFLPEERTLLKGVTMLPPGTVRIYDLDRDVWTDRKYWEWNSYGNPDKQDATNIDEAAAHLAELFRRSVTERLSNDSKNESVGIPLSGGLDSRAILSAIRHPEGMYTFTFGKPDAPDSVIAQKLSEVTKSRHEFIEIDHRNWLEPRLKGIWWTDGQLNLLHMHGVEALGRSSRQIAIQLNGGAQQFIRGAASSYELTRLRRFQRLATVVDDRMMVTRLPFYDYKMIDYLSQVPEQHVKDDRLYLKMLLGHFPKLFHGIADANTGIPPDTKIPITRKFIFRVMRRLGLVNYQFHDYPEWIRYRIGVFRFFLLNSQVRLNDLGFKDQIDRLLIGRQAGWSHKECEQLCRLLTVEAYLRFLEQPDAVDSLIDQSFHTAPNVFPEI